MLELGKQLRVIRAINGESAKQMAEKLKISPAYLSTIEKGSRNVPQGFFDEIVKNYELSFTEQNNLRAAIAVSPSTMKIDTENMPLAQKEILFTLSQSSLDEATIEKINYVIKKNKK